MCISGRWARSVYRHSDQVCEQQASRLGKFSIIKGGRALFWGNGCLMYFYPYRPLRLFPFFFLVSVMEAWGYLKLRCISLPSLSTLIRSSVGMLPTFFRGQFWFPSSSVVLSVVPDQQRPRDHLGACYKCKFSAPP